MVEYYFDKEYIPLFSENDNDNDNEPRHNPFLDLSLSINDSSPFNSKITIKENYLFRDNIIEEPEPNFFNKSNDHIEPFQKDEKIQIIGNDNNSDKETNEKTDKNENEIQKVKNIINDKEKIKANNLFQVKENKTEKRIDYVIKDIKVYMCKFFKEYGNELIHNCNFQNRLNKAKLFAPSYKYFTGNSNFKDNKKFLQFSMEEIFTYPDETLAKDDNRLQRQNKDTIKNIKDHIEEKYSDDIPERCQKMLDFFKMSFEDAISLFYESEYYKKYCSSEKARRDEYFIKVKGYSILEKNAFIKLIKDCEN